MRTGDRALSANWESGVRLRPVGLGQVRLGGFLGEHVRANEGSLLAALECPIHRGFEAQATGEQWDGPKRRRAGDTDLYKWIEAAAYSLAYEPDPVIAGELARVGELIAGIQDPSGYIHSQTPAERAFDPQVRNELYLAGHFFEAAVAHHAATGETLLLDAARRWADLLDRHLRAGHPYFEESAERDHPGVELGLVRLAQATGEERYLALAAELAGRATVTGRVAELKAGVHERHAVCAMYTLTAWAELAMQTGEDRWLEPLMPLLDELVSTRLYLNGGMGINEIIPLEPWNLPQVGSIAETCASVGLMMFARRLHALTAESRYFDVIETALYNSVVAAMSPDHLGLFYFNPLRIIAPGDEGRQDLPGERTRLPDLHRTSCCLPNTWRLFASLPEYVFSVGEGEVAVNLYSDAECHVDIGGVRVAMQMRTTYPEDGEVALTVRPERPVRFRLLLRIPGWCRNATVTTPDGVRSRAWPGGYRAIEREWAEGDTVHVSLPMLPEAVWSAPEVACYAGQVAFRRGPALFCLEEQDAEGMELARVAVVGEPIAGGTRMRLPVAELAPREFGPTPYGYQPPRVRGPEREVALIPYWLRGNRESRRWVTLLPSVGV